MFNLLRDGPFGKKKKKSKNKARSRGTAAGRVLVFVVGAFVEMPGGGEPHL